MRQMRTGLAVPIVLLGVLGLAGCSKSGNKSTNPPGATLELNSGNLVTAAQYPHRFFSAGTFPYHCSIHNSMTGVIIVSDSAPAADTLDSVNITGFAFSPASLTIHTGGKVTWTNNQPSTTHTVTSN